MKLHSSRPARGLPVALLAVFLAVGAAWASGLPWAFVHHGNFQRMMHSGNTAGQVALSALPQAPGTWGVGATAGLKGEIVQIDGRVLVSPGSDAGAATAGRRAGVAVRKWPRTGLAGHRGVS
jgi:hypothetical protein